MGGSAKLGRRSMGFDLGEEISRLPRQLLAQHRKILAFSQINDKLIERIKRPFKFLKVVGSDWRSVFGRKSIHKRSLGERETKSRQNCSLD